MEKADAIREGTPVKEVPRNRLTLIHLANGPLKTKGSRALIEVVRSRDSYPGIDIVRSKKLPSLFAKQRKKRWARIRAAIESCETDTSESILNQRSTKAENR